MNSLYWTDCIYPLFLSSLGSCTYANMEDLDLQNELDNLAIRAIATFKFPKVRLDYEYDNETVDDVPKGYHFLSDEVTYREINVIVS